MILAILILADEKIVWPEMPPLVLAQLWSQINGPFGKAVGYLAGTLEFNFRK